MSTRPKYLPSEKIRAALQQFADNGRWGTCGSCPTQTLGKAGEIKLPALCENTDRSEHHLGLDEIARLVAIERLQVDGYIWKGAEVKICMARYDRVPVGSVGVVTQVHRQGEYNVVFKGGGIAYTFPGMDLQLLD